MNARYTTAHVRLPWGKRTNISITPYQLQRLRERYEGERLQRILDNAAANPPCGTSRSAWARHRLSVVLDPIEPPGWWHYARRFCLRVVQLGYYEGRWPFAAVKQALGELKRARQQEALWF
jgi:uncharacterized protein YigA (DUF484 family)